LVPEDDGAGEGDPRDKPEDDIFLVPEDDIFWCPRMTGRKEDPRDKPEDDRVREKGKRIKKRDV